MEEHVPGDIRLASGNLSARVSPVGAQLVGLAHDGLGDLLWRGDPHGWADQAPILFPVVGRSAGDVIRVGGAAYPMPLHGFARTMRFTVLRQGRQRCRLRLADTPETRQHYPFAFRLDLDYALADDALRVEARVHNPGRVRLPVGFGFHPGFRWPLAPGLDKSAHELLFPDDRRLLVQRAQDGLVLPETTAIDLPGGRLSLSERLFDAGAMVISCLRSRAVTLQAPGAPASVTVAFRNLPSLGLWMKPGADFLCIEPWASHADVAGFGGDVFDRPGIVSVEPGDATVFAMDIAVRPPG
jgi:galactose mutarotase-like enzyme